MTTPHKTPRNRSIPPWRWAWIGFALSVIIWIGSTVYFQRVQQFADIDYETGGMEYADYAQLTRQHIRYAMVCKAISGILTLGSLVYLVSQSDMRRGRRRD